MTFFYLTLAFIIIGFLWPFVKELPFTLSDDKLEELYKQWLKRETQEEK